MGGTTYLCGTDDPCPTHGRFLYYCTPCHVAWQEANPRTTAALARYASGKGSRESVDAARKLDREARQ